MGESTVARLQGCKDARLQGLWRFWGTPGENLHSFFSAQTDVLRVRCHVVPRGTAMTVIRPDRMFSGIQETWNNVNIGGGDVKELVPEFYEGDGEFLTNALRR
jgi:hypothetical protein